MNETIKLQLSHRSIRKFKDIEISEEIIKQLVSVAQATATSSYAQSYSIISLTSRDKINRIAEIGQQPYINNAKHVFLMIADQHRNACIVKESGGDLTNFSSFDRFFIAATDAILAAQNIVIAAESLGLGTVLLGSILNDVSALNKEFDIPEYATAVIGIALGYPDQEPLYRPRMPQNMMHFENTYVRYPNYSEVLRPYSQSVGNYYSARQSIKHIDSFDKMILIWSKNVYEGRLRMLDDIRKQNLIKF